MDKLKDLDTQEDYNIIDINNPTYFKNVIELLPGSVYWKNREGSYLGCNNNCAQILGLKSPKDIYGKKLHDILEKRFADALHEIDELVMSQGREIALEEAGPSVSGKTAIYLTTKIPLFGKNRQVIGLLGVSFNITDRKVMEKELNKAKEQAEQLTKTVQIYLKNILVSLPENFYWMDKEGRILGCNQNQTKLFGVTNVNELIGKNIYDLAEMLKWDKKIADEIRKHDLEVMATKESKKIEEIAYIDGKKRTFLSYKSPLLDDNGEVIGIFGVTIDISERKQMEEELLLAKEKAEHANQAKSEFIMNMSHDLRTPFSGILGFAKILQMKETDAEKKEILGYIVQSSERLLGLLNEILALTKSSKTDFPVLSKRFNFFEILNKVIELMQAEIKYKNLAFKLDCREDVPLWLMGDKSRLHRILLNLLGNAVKFTQKGHIAIYIKAIERSENKVLLKIDIEDTGIGIPEANYQTIFEQFSRLTSAYQGKYQGSGLGLYIVKKFVEEMGGKITVSSKVNRGTTFHCILPFTIEQQSECEEESKLHSLSKLEINPKIAASGAKQVLLIEDDPIAQKMAKIMLEDFLKCTIDVANNDIQALALVDTKLYDLILMDIGLPNSDGFTLTKKIRRLNKHYANTYIIGLTAHIDEDASQAEYMDEMILKPLSEEICIKLVNLLATT